MDNGLIAGVIVTLLALLGFYVAKDKRASQDKTILNSLLRGFIKEKKNEFQAKSLSDSIREFNKLTDDESDTLRNRKRK